jgi:hypothetical protein
MLQKRQLGTGVKALDRFRDRSLASPLGAVTVEWVEFAVNRSKM